MLSFSINYACGMLTVYLGLWEQHLSHEAPLLSRSQQHYRYDYTSLSSHGTVTIILVYLQLFPSIISAGLVVGGVVLPTVWPVWLVVWLSMVGCRGVAFPAVGWGEVCYLLFH